MLEPGRRLVVDASVATKWHLQDEELVDEALGVLTAFASGELDLIAPAHILLEVPSAITVASLGRSPRISWDEGRAAIQEFLDLHLSILDEPALALTAFELTHEHGCAFYDAVYLAAAIRIGARLVVADRRFFTRVAGHPNIIWLGDFPSNSAEH
jgi:predicted nucleic acid-binding protein